jgi:4a-hydroxytetrahydrobiopterin dehydratase
MFIETDGALRTEIAFDDFAGAFAAATRVALIAESQGHHPDLTVTWGRLGIVCTSHDAGRTVTERDRRLAAAIEEALS